MVKIQLNPQHLKQLKVSKHRNSKNKSVQFVDSSGKKIVGHPVRHFIQTSSLQQERFNTKFEAFSLLSKDELKQLFDTNPKDKVKGSTDKAALVQAYYNSCFEAFKGQNKADLDLINGNILNNLNPVEKQALNDAKEILNKEVELEETKTE